MTEHEWDDLWNEFAQAWNDGSPPGPDREAAARSAIEAQAVAAWLASPEAEQRLAAALQEHQHGSDAVGYCYQGHGKDTANEARAILAAMRRESP